MGEPKSPYFYDFGIFGRVPKRQHQLFLFLETPGHLKQIKKIQIFLKLLSLYISIWWTSKVPMFLEKAGAENPGDLFNKMLQILNMMSITKKHEIESW